MASITTCEKCFLIECSCEADKMQVIENDARARRDGYVEIEGRWVREATITPPPEDKRETCACGCKVSKYYMKKHVLTKRHELLLRAAENFRANQRKLRGLKPKATPSEATPIVETPIVETPIVETPIVETPSEATPSEVMTLSIAPALSTIQSIKDKITFNLRVNWNVFETRAITEAIVALLEKRETLFVLMTIVYDSIWVVKPTHSSEMDTRPHFNIILSKAGDKQSPTYHCVWDSELKSIYISYTK